ncbi:MAG: hypothetical protein ACYS83_02455 [Planctomycetota bacterium]
MAVTGVGVLAVRVATDVSVGTAYFTAIPFLLLAMLLCIYGISCYAKGKGYSGSWGWFGIFFPFGIIIVVCLPDRHRTAKKTPAQFTP